MPNHEPVKHTEPTDAELRLRKLAWACIAVVSASYLLGLLLHDGTMGGQREDFLPYHRAAVQTFIDKPFFEALQGYAHGSTPLYYALMGLIVPLLSGDMAFRILSVLVTLATGGLLLPFLRARFPLAPQSSHLFLTAAWLASLYTRGCAVWPTNDNFAFIFVFVAGWLVFGPLRKHGPKLGLLVALAICTSLAVYTRQTFAWLPIWAAVAVWTSGVGVRSFAIFAGVGGLCAVPLLLLFKLWGGPTPPGFGMFVQSSGPMATIPYIGGFLLWYSVPFVFAGGGVLAAKKAFTGEGRARLMIVIAVAFVVWLVALHDFAYLPWGGGGLVKRACDVLFGEWSASAFKVIGFGGVALAAGLVMANVPRNLALLGAVTLALAASHIVMNKYFDPLITVVLLLVEAPLIDRTVNSGRGWAVLAWTLIFDAIAVVWCFILGHCGWLFRPRLAAPAYPDLRR